MEYLIVYGAFGLLVFVVTFVMDVLTYGLVKEIFGDADRNLRPFWEYVIGSVFWPMWLIARVLKIFLGD